VCSALLLVPGLVLADVEVTSRSMELVIKDKGHRINYRRVIEGELLGLKTSGPMTLRLSVRALRKRRSKSGGAGKLNIVRDGRYQTTWSFSVPGGRGAKVVKPFRGNVSASVTAHIAVPEGEHTYGIKLLPGSGVRLAVHTEAAASFDQALALGPETDLSPEQAAPEPPLASQPPPPVPGPPAAPASPPPAPESPPAAQPPPTEVVAEASPADQAAGAEMRAESLGIVESDRATSASSTSSPDVSESETVQVVSPDGSVSASTKALADAVTEGYNKLGRPGTFHRVAIPRFEELGMNVSEKHLGQLIAELLAVELSQRQPFVLVERERLDQVMREHRLKDLGVVDGSTAAQFGKVLGAESLISGTVAEAGPKYVVTVRQVDVESGRVLVAGNLEMNREGLIALSSDAVVTRSKVGALFRSALIPGWGQLYNNQTIKGGAFFAAGLGTAGTALGFYMGAIEARSLYERNRPRTVSKRELANDYLQVTNALLWAYAAVWAINMLDAYLSGADTTTVQLPNGAAGAASHF
jgi:TolB-like protein